MFGWDMAPTTGRRPNYEAAALALSLGDVQLRGEAAEKGCGGGLDIS